MQRPRCQRFKMYCTASAAASPEPALEGPDVKSAGMPEAPAPPVPGAKRKTAKTPTTRRKKTDALIEDAIQANDTGDAPSAKSKVGRDCLTAPSNEIFQTSCSSPGLHSGQALQSHTWQRNCISSRLPMSSRDHVPSLPCVPEPAAAPPADSKHPNRQNLVGPAAEYPQTTLRKTPSIHPLDPTLRHSSLCKT